jgi:hydroxymethylglutaryl-CoA lyase
VSCPELPLPASVVLREVGPRDGLQGERPLAPAERARLVEALAAAGLRRIEAVSFVSPRLVPAMAGAAEVLALVARRADLVLAALVPNRRGAELALEAGVDELTATVAVSPAYNERNVGMSVEESLAEIAEVCALARPSGIPVDAVVSCAFGSPYEGDIEPDAVAVLVGRLRDAGVAAITVADTTGMATPRRVRDLLDALGPDVGLHLHETRGTGLVNAYAALLCGARRFDTAVGGLGGSPFATGAAGNLATEGLVALLDDLGVETGVRLDELLAACRLVEELVDHRLPSPVAYAGPRDRLASSS